MGRWSTVIGMLVSIATAYLVMNAASIMDYVQALFSFFIAPLFGTVVLGMLWKRATHAGGFWGLLAGTAASIGMFVWVHDESERAAVYRDESEMRSRWRRICIARCGAGLICVGVTVVVSLMTKPVPMSSLSGLVYGVTPIPDDGAKTLWQKPIFWAVRCDYGVLYVESDLLLDACELDSDRMT